MRPFSKLVTIAFLGTMATSPARGADKLQQDVSPPPVAITREQADAILNELRQIRKILESQQRPAPALPQPAQRAKLSLGDSFALGQKEAPLTLVEFSDYQCGFCRQFHVSTYNELRKSYIDTGKLRFISRDLPLGMHADAPRAAEAVRCAGDQGSLPYWSLRDVLIKNSPKLSEDSILAYARDLQLDLPAFRACLETGKYRPAVEKDGHVAEALSISGTPTFILGETTKDGVDGTILVGAQPYSVFDAKLQELLNHH